MKRTKELIRQYLNKRTNGQTYMYSWFDKLTDIVGHIVFVCGIGTIIYIIYRLIK